MTELTPSRGASYVHEMLRIRVTSFADERAVRPAKPGTVKRRWSARTAAGLFLRRSVWILILPGANPVAVCVVIAAVVATVVAVGSGGCGTDGRRTKSRTAINPAWIPPGVASYRATSYRMRRSNASAIPASGVNTSGVNGAASEVSTATSVETSTTTTDTSTTSSARERVIGDKTGGDENYYSECSESKPKHGASSLPDAFRLAWRFDANVPNLRRARAGCLI